jgi:phosphoglycolate phosphatase-like HAD superfamily hydrolase
MSLTSRDDLVATTRDRWMHRLVDHYRATLAAHPHDTLAVVFDIDGTIVDTRHLIRHTLLAYDRSHGTDLFRTLDVDEIDVHEIEIDALLARLDIMPSVHASIRAFYFERLWRHDSMIAAHLPYRGVMEVIRWFQLQDRTVVALNTGRSEAMRHSTLLALNELGREYRVNFADDLLLMNDRGDAVVRSKVLALDALRARGLRIVAVVDNEPENLEAMAHADPTRDVLFLHASTIFLSARRPVPRSVTGERYDLQPFARHEELAGHVQLVWAGVVDRPELDRFLDAAVGTLSVPVRADPYGRPEIGRADEPPHRRSALRLDDVVDAVGAAGRVVRFELQAGGPLLEHVLSRVAEWELPQPSVWISGAFHDLGEHGLRLTRDCLPQATISCAADFLAPLVFGALEHAIDVLDVLRDWGVDRLSIQWEQPRVRDLIGELERWGREVDVGGIADAEALLQAALLLPRSVTARPSAFW